MPSPRNDQPYFDNPILRLQRRIALLEAEVKALQASSRPSIPIYDSQTMSELITNEGEVWITGNIMFFQSNGVRRVTSNP